MKTNLILAVVLVLCWVGLAWAWAQTETPPPLTGKDEILRDLVLQTEDRLHWSDLEGALELLKVMKWVVSTPPAGAQEGECEWFTPHAWTPSTDLNTVEIVVDEYGPCCHLTADVYVYLESCWVDPELIIVEELYCPDEGTTQEQILYRGPAGDYQLSYDADCRCFVQIYARVVSRGTDSDGNPITLDHGTARCNMICGEEACRD